MDQPTKPKGMLQSLSLFIAPHAETVCRLLSQYGGCVVNEDGTLRTGVTYVRREGTAVARIVHVEDVETREAYMFVLNEVTGGYMSGKLELWPLASAGELLPDVHLHLIIPQLAGIVEEFLADMLPSKRPEYADPYHLRRQLMYTAMDPDVWQQYWISAKTETVARPARSSRRRRIHHNVWPSRKLLCVEE